MGEGGMRCAWVGGGGDEGNARASVSEWRCAPTASMQGASSSGSSRNVGCTSGSSGRTSMRAQGCVCVCGDHGAQSLCTCARACLSGCVCARACRPSLTCCICAMLSSYMAASVSGAVSGTLRWLMTMALWRDMWLWLGSLPRQASCRILRGGRGGGGGGGGEGQGGAGQGRDGRG